MNDKPQQGTWTLISPDGTEYKGNSPLKCCQIERQSRVPNGVLVDRVKKFVNLCDLCEEAKAQFTLGKDTPAEISICLTCKNTLFNHSIHKFQEV